MKKVISIFALMCILCTSIIFPVKASNVEALAVEEYATDIYQQMLVDSGLAEQSGVLYAHYSGGDRAIFNACIAGEGTATSIRGLKNLCSSSLICYNVYYYHD